jgi:phosphatidylglycerophosphate synthase
MRAAVVGALTTALLGPFAASWAALGADYVGRSLGLFAVAVLAVAGLVGAHHPFNSFGWANQVTLVRVALVALVGALIGEAPAARVAWLAVAATTLAAALDGLDGHLARQRGTTSAFGARFDMETDAALILALSLLVWQHGKAGLWIVACGLMRYAFVAAGRVLPWLARPLRSTIRGKSVAIGQLGGLAAALSPPVPPPYSDAVAVATLAALTWSFALDVTWLWQEAR